MIDVKYPNGTTGDSKSNTVAGNSSIISTARDLYYDQLQEPSDRDYVEFVEIVRCKDCKKYIPCQKLPIGTSKWCDLFDRATCEMNYCGWAERREDELLITDKD